MNRTRMTSAIQLTAAPRPRAKQEGVPLVCNNCNTSIRVCVKPTNQLSAETKAQQAVETTERAKRAERAIKVVLGLLKRDGYKKIQQLDLIAQDVKGEWICFEVKGKELYTPGKAFPHYGIGLNKSQLYLRTKLLEVLGWRTYLINYVEETNQVYGQYLDELEKGVFYDTPKNDIRIYPIDNFKAIHDAPNQNLGGLV